MLVSKLDRLSPDVAFASGLGELSLTIHNLRDGELARRVFSDADNTSRHPHVRSPMCQERALIKPQKKRVRFSEPIASLGDRASGRPTPTYLASHRSFRPSRPINPGLQSEIPAARTCGRKRDSD